MPEDYEISPEKFARALDQVVTDAAFRKRLDERPVETLADLGITVRDKQRAELVGRRLSEMIPRQLPGAGAGLGPVAETYVHVGVSVGVSVVVDVVTATSIEKTRQEIQKINLEKATKQLAQRR